MNKTRTLVTNTIYIFVGIFVVAFVMAILIPSLSANAAPCAKNDQIATAPKDANGKNCFDLGYDEITSKYAPNLSLTDYNKAITDCESTSGSLTGDWHNATNQGNCANAIRSCYENIVDTRACTDKNVTSYVASCSNDGNVGNDGDCGFNRSIDYANQENPGDGDADYHNNADMQNRRKQDFLSSQEALCEKDANGSSSALDQCKRDNEQIYNDCYSQVGGDKQMIPDSQLGDVNNCVIGKAGNDQQCSRFGGVWSDTDTGTGGNKVSKGCHASYTDLKNADACNNAKPPGKWVQPDANDPDHWECESPTGTPQNPNAGQGSNSTPASGSKKFVVPGQCGQAKTNLIDCGSKVCQTSSSADFSGSAVIGCVLRFGIQALTFLVGVAAVGGIAWEAVQYARAQDDQSIVSGAKNRIRDIIIGLVVYAFMIVAINWLVPGGVLGG